METWRHNALNDEMAKKQFTILLNFHLYKNVSVNISVLKTYLNKGTEGMAQYPRVTGQSFLNINSSSYLVLSHNPYL